MPDRAKPAKREASSNAFVQARTTRSRSKALLSNKENESICAPIAKGPDASSSESKARVATRAQPEAVATSTGVQAQAASKQSSTSQPKLPSKSARADSKVKAVDKSAQPTLRTTKAKDVPNDSTRSIHAKARKHPKSTNQDTVSQPHQQPAEEVTKNVPSKATAEASVSVDLMPEGEALWERLTAQNTELNLLRVQAAAHKAALAASNKAAAEAKEAAAQTMEDGATGAKKAADLVALLHLKEVQYTKVRAERDAEHVAKAAAVQALAASKLANHALIQHIKFLQQQLGADDMETTAAAPASTGQSSMIPLRGVNPLFTDDAATIIAQGGNDDEVVPAGGQTPFTPSAFLTLSTTPQSAVRGAPADDISMEDASAACTASAHSLSAAEAAALEFDSSIALGSNVQSQADVPATAAHADSVAVSSGSMIQDSRTSISAPAPSTAGKDTNISLASHPIACTEDQPSPDDQSISAPLASQGLQLSRDSQTGGDTDHSGEAVGAYGDLVPYDKYLVQRQGLPASQLATAAPARMRLSATASPYNMSPMSLSSLFDFDMSLPEGKYGLQMTPTGGKSPFTPSDFLSFEVPQLAVGPPSDANINLEDATAARKADMPAAAADADAAESNTSNVMGSGNSANAAALHAAAGVSHPGTASHPTTGSADQTSAAAQSNSPAIAIMNPRPDCIGVPGTFVASDSTASWTARPCHDKQTGPRLISMEDAGAACKASAHSLSAAEAAASQFDTSNTVGSSVWLQAGLPAAAAHADLVASSSGSVRHGSHDSVSAPALHVADHTGEAAGADDNLVTYDKYLGQQPGLIATELATAAPAPTWLPALPITSRPFSIASMFEFDMSLPEGKYGLHMTPVGSKSPFTSSDFCNFDSLQSAVSTADLPDTDTNMEDTSAPHKASAQSLSAVGAAAAQLGTSNTTGDNTQVQADMPAAAADAGNAEISTSNVMGRGNSATPAVLHAAADVSHPGFASHPTTGSADQTLAAAQDHSPIIAVMNPSPDCTGVPGTLMASDSTASLAVRLCHDKQTGPVDVTAAGTANGSRQPSSTAKTSSVRLKAEALGKRRFSTANRRCSAGGKHTSAQGGLLGASDWPTGKRLKPTNDSPATEQLSQSSNITQGLSGAAHRQQGRPTEPPQGPAQWNKAADGTAIFPMGICKPAPSPLNPHRKPRVPSRAANSLRAFAATLVSGDDVQANGNARGMSGQEAPHPPGPFAMVFKAGLPSAPPAATTTPPIQPDSHPPAHAQQQHEPQPGVDAAQLDLPQPQPAGDRATSQNDCTDAPSHVEQDQQTQKHAAQKAEPVAAPKLTQPMLPSAPAQQVSADMQPDLGDVLQQPLGEVSTSEGEDRQTGGSHSAADSVAPSPQAHTEGTTLDTKAGTQSRAGRKRLAIEVGESDQMDMPAGKRHKLAVPPTAAGLQIKAGPFTMGAGKPPESPLEARPKSKSRPRRRVQPQQAAVTEKHLATHADAPSSFAQHVGSQPVQQLSTAENTAGLVAIVPLQPFTPAETAAGLAAIVLPQQQQPTDQALQEPQQPVNSSKDRQNITPQPQQEGVQKSSQSPLNGAQLSKAAALQHQTQPPERVAERALDHTPPQQLAQQPKPMPKDVSHPDAKTLKDIQHQASEGAESLEHVACKLPKDQHLPNHPVRKAQQQQPKSCTPATNSTHMNSEKFGSPVKQQRRNPFAPFGLPMHTPMHQASATPARLDPLTAKQQLLRNQLPSRLPAAFKRDQITTDPQGDTSDKHLPAAHQAMAAVQQQDGQTANGSPTATGPGVVPAAPQPPAGDRADNMPSRKRSRDAEDEGISLLQFAARKRSSRP